MPAATLAQPVDFVGERQHAVEQGLLPAVVLEGEPVAGYSLRERMQRYEVPGASVAAVAKAGEKQRQRLVPVSPTEFVSPGTASLVKFDHDATVMEIDGRWAERVE